jgi:hypothetical protein
MRIVCDCERRDDGFVGVAEDGATAQVREDVGGHGDAVTTVTGLPTDILCDDADDIVTACALVRGERMRQKPQSRHEEYHDQQTASGKWFSAEDESEQHDEEKKEFLNADTVAGAAEDLESISCSLSSWPAAARDQATTLILLDWDDTLFPTSVLSAALLINAEQPIEGLSPVLQSQLLSLQESTLQLLKACQQVGHVTIVTNAMEGWVESCSQRAFPQVWNLLLQEDIDVISAQTRYAAQCGEDPTDWKVSAFNKEMDDMCAMEGDGGCCWAVKLMSIGDSQFERDACHLMALRSKLPHLDSL